MIKIIKGIEPGVISQNKASWTATLVSKYQSGIEPTDTEKNRYNNTDIKAALIDECKSKCMYCESYIRPVSYEHIEHIKPKSRDKYPELSFDWENLGLACQVCNTKKGNEYDEMLPFVNPYEDNPDDFFSFNSLCIWHQIGNQRAELTEHQLELNRPDLLIARKTRIESLRNLADKCAQTDSVSLKRALLKQLEIEVSDDKPYTFCAKNHYKILLDELNETI